MYKIFKHRELPRIPALGEAHIKLQWYNIFPSLFLHLQRNFFPLQLPHQTFTTKLCYLRSSAFYRAPTKLPSDQHCFTQWSSMIKQFVQR